MANDTQAFENDSLTAVNVKTGLQAVDRKTQFRLTPTIFGNITRVFTAKNGSGLAQKAT
jgi:hypothetical protein